MKKNNKKTKEKYIVSLVQKNMCHKKEYSQIKRVCVGCFILSKTQVDKMRQSGGKF